jgi:hypothetical protein
MDFLRPFKLSGFDQDLPAGRYEIRFEEIEIVLHGFSKWQPTRCMLPVPASMLSSNQLAAMASVDPNELRQRLAEDH